MKYNHSWFYDTWKNLQFDIMRYDTARVAWLYIIGGLYVDQDVEALQSNEPLLRGVEAVLMEDNRGKHDNPWPGPHVDNWWMASSPGHPLFLSYLRAVHTNAGRFLVLEHANGSTEFVTWKPKLEIQKINSPVMGATLMLTGPHQLGYISSLYMTQFSSNRIRILGRFGKRPFLLEDNSGSTLFDRWNSSYAVHRMHGSWVDSKAGK